MLNMNLIKLLAIFVFFGFAECAAGACLNYGHACWGAHGKRSQPQNDKEEISKILNSNWFLSRLIQTPQDLKYALDNPVENKENSPDQRRFEDWTQLTDDDIFNSQYADVNRIRLPKHLDKRSL